MDYNIFMETMDIKNKNGRVEIKWEDIKNSVVFSTLKQDKTKLVFSFVKDNITYYFKANSKFSYDQNEILASLLLIHNGIKTNEPEFASFIVGDKKYNGIISKDIIDNRKNTELINYEHIYDIYDDYDLCVDFMHRRIQYYCEVYNLKADVNLYNDLSTLALTYYLTGQQDFTHRNIEFKIEKVNDKKVLSLLPIIDKSVTFFACIDETNAFNKITLEKIKANPKEEAHKLTYGLMFEAEDFELNTHSRIVRELAINILKNKKLEQVFRNFANFDFKNAIKEYTLKNPDFKFNADTIQKALIMFESNREDLVEMVKRLDKNFFATNVKKDNTERQFE